MLKLAARTFRGVVIFFAVMMISLNAYADDKQKYKEKSEEDLGLRKETIYDEKSVTPAHGTYSEVEPGKSRKFERAFENSPPLIPHDLTGMLPIAETNNMCIGCHMPDTARSIGATALPKSHFFDIDTNEDLGGKLDGKRYNCMQCHVPQMNIPEPIKNTFRPDFRSRKDKTSSNLLDSLNEGIKAE